MTQGLVRYQDDGDFHAVTFSCYQRRAYLATASARGLFARALETMRERYEFAVSAYVVMPEHVHLLVSEPNTVPLATALQAVKLSVAVKSCERPFWQKRYYDFNVFTMEKWFEKLNYIHQNPVRRGLVRSAAEWEWSSARHYATGEVGAVEIESEMTAARRERGALLRSSALNGDERQVLPGGICGSHVSEARRGAPRVCGWVRCGPSGATEQGSSLLSSPLSEG